MIKKIVNDNKKFKVIDNIERLGPLGNHIKALSVKEFDDNDIIVHLDGDDKFIGSDVLSTLDNAYSKNKNHLVNLNINTSSLFRAEEYLTKLLKSE